MTKIPGINFGADLPEPEDEDIDDLPASDLVKEALGFDPDEVDYDE